MHCEFVSCLLGSVPVTHTCFCWIDPLYSLNFVSKSERVDSLFFNSSLTRCNSAAKRCFSFTLKDEKRVGAGKFVAFSNVFENAQLLPPGSFFRPQPEFFLNDRKAIESIRSQCLKIQTNECCYGEVWYNHGANERNVSAKMKTNCGRLCFLRTAPWAGARERSKYFETTASHRYVYDDKEIASIRKQAANAGETSFSRWKVSLISRQIVTVRTGRRVTASNNWAWTRQTRM